MCTQQVWKCLTWLKYAGLKFPAWFTATLRSNICVFCPLFFPKDIDSQFSLNHLLVWPREWKIGSSFSLFFFSWKRITGSKSHQRWTPLMGLWSNTKTWESGSEQTLTLKFSSRHYKAWSFHFPISTAIKKEKKSFILHSKLLISLLACSLIN